MRLRITVEGVTYDVDVEVLDSAPHTIATTAAPIAAPVAVPAIAAPAPVPAAPVPAPAPAPAPAPSAGGDGQITEVKSLIAGNVMSIAVKAGDTVAADDTLLVLEAMKMESNVPAPTGGIVKEIFVSTGDSVETGRVLVCLG